MVLTAALLACNMLTVDVVVVVAVVGVAIGGRGGVLHVLHVLGLAWVQDDKRRGEEIHVLVVIITLVLLLL